MSVSKIVDDLVSESAEYISQDALPLSFKSVAPPTKGLPTKLSQLNQQLSRTYDLSVTAASQLSIPVIGSISGGFDRRVVVLERAAFKELTKNDIKYQYGYAIRLVITVNKVTSDLKLSLPFLAASAQVGHIEGKWILQVVGLSGAKIDSSILPPTDLNVETFVLAKQSLSELIAAINDSTTTFDPVLIGTKKPLDILEREYQISIARAYALGRIERNRTTKEAINDLDSLDKITTDTIRDTYKDFAGITTISKKPTNAIRVKARAILGDIKVQPR